MSSNTTTQQHSIGNFDMGTITRRVGKVAEAAVASLDDMTKAVSIAVVVSYHDEHDETLAIVAPHLKVPGEHESAEVWVRAADEHMDFFNHRENLVGDLAPDADDLSILWGQEGEHPLFKLADWRDEVARGDTLLGYWERASAFLYNKADDLVEQDDTAIAVELVDGVIRDVE